MPDDLALPPIGPDEATVQRMQDSHQSFLASIDPETRGNPYFGKPELAAKHRQEAQERFDSLLIRNGAVPPVSETFEQRVERQFEESRGSMPIGENLADQLETEVERVEALSEGERDQMVAEMKKEHGDEGYDRLLDEAQAGMNEPLTAAMKASWPFLNLAAAYGRRMRAYDRARAAFDASLRQRA